MREVEKLRIEMRKPADPRQRPGRPDEQGKADPDAPDERPPLEARRESLPAGA